ncbi:DUF502 domain-containing protein [Fuerstiella marisgermanici]|uniref:DUF502 domain-containing protein n=1 Tax=Fuerstiella marisgermanici TaxID=1891926 RepID=A0A1P8WD39_9PLAN|nr:DUF502 domain-containing protein [Fuerstiella marisgermanici]APZ91986.1 hypothetical protein Fuma_01587 [Fuerstiella marisgermanici]
MVKKHIERSIGFFRATALGGVLFILPLAVVVGLLGYVYSFVVVLYDPVKEWIPVSTAAGIAGLFAVAVAALLLACFAAGLMAHRAIGRKAAQFVEKYLTTFFPKYAIYKDLLAGNIGGTRDVPSLTPVLVQTPECQRIAFESSRTPDNSVVVFFPGAPDTWIGTVGIVSADKVERLNVPFNDVVGHLEQLGRDLGPALPTTGGGLTSSEPGATAQ